MSVNSVPGTAPISSKQPASSAFAARFQLEHEHWKAVLSHIEESQTAQLIVDHFEKHTHLQASHPAIYLRAKRRSLQARCIRQRWLTLGRISRKTAQVFMGMWFWACSQSKTLSKSFGKHKAATPTAGHASSTELVWPPLIVQEN